MSQDTRTPPTPGGGTLMEISEEECFRLLATQPVGRLAVAPPEGPPLVVPVNYFLDKKAIVFRSSPGLKVRLLRQAPVSFQVDNIDLYHHSGWTVLVHGVAYEASHWETDHVELASWAGGDKRTWVRIVPTAVTGRRLLPAELEWPTDGRGYL